MTLLFQFLMLSFAAAVVAGRALDSVFGTLAPGFLALVALLSAALLTSRHRQILRFKENVGAIAVACSVTAFFLIRGGAELSPVALGWDGANHIAVSRWLLEHGTHSVISERQMNLAWGGIMPLYPWGLQSVVSLLAFVTGARVHAVVSVLVAVIFGLTFLALYLMSIRRSVSRAAGALAFSIAFMSPFALYGHLIFNYWIQLTGLLLLLAMQLEVDRESEPRFWPRLLLLGQATIIVYPVFAPVVGVLIAGAVFRSSSSAIGRLGYLLMFGALFLPLSIPVMRDLWEVRKELQGGMPDFYNCLTPTEQTEVSVFTVVLAAGALIFTAYMRDTLFLPPAALLGATLIPALSGGNSYLFWKFLFSGLLFLVPALGALLSKLPPYCAGAIYSVAISYVLSHGAQTTLSLRQALPDEHIRMRFWTEEKIPDAKVYYVARGYTQSWVMALSEKPEITVPKDFDRVAVEQTWSYDPREILTSLEEEVPEGAFMVASRNEITPSARYWQEFHCDLDLCLYKRGATPS